MGTALRIENLGKRYKIGQRQPYRRLTEAISGAAAAPLEWLKRVGTPREADDQIWALQGISFEVKEGEVVGIIGRNGAGKSTLLKILSRITEPTCGDAWVYGRIGSLLEVGTGFHTELTGRENIFLNGTILGMRRGEIVRKFDQIVDFSGVEKFLDTPVKHYSSGMYMRLAFAVAAHLDPEILLVDEVLAVGDAEFQKKCMGKMSQVASEGRTVLFVSHNTLALKRLCTRGVLLNGGRLVREGTIGPLVDEYVQGSSAAGELRWPDLATAPGDKVAKITAMRVCQRGETRSEIDTESDFELELDYHCLSPGAKLAVSCSITSADGAVLFSTVTTAGGQDQPVAWSREVHPEGQFRARVAVKNTWLNVGLYGIRFNIHRYPDYTLHAYETIYLSVREGESSVLRPADYHGEWPGMIRVKCQWSAERLAP